MNWRALFIKVCVVDNYTKMMSKITSSRKMDRDTKMSQEYLNFYHLYSLMRRFEFNLSVEVLV